MKKDRNPFVGPAATLYDTWFSTPSGKYVEAVENQQLFSMIGNVTRQTILDVGCGTGNHLIALHQKGARFCVGIDSSKDMLRVCRSKIRTRSITLVRADAGHLPFRDKAFHVSLCVTVLEFLPSPAQAIAEMQRVSGGKIVLATLNRLAFSSLLRKLESRLKPSLFRDARFISPFTLKRMVRRMIPRARIQWRTTLAFFPLFLPHIEPLLYKIDQLLCRSRFPFGTFMVMTVHWNREQPRAGKRFAPISDKGNRYPME